MFIVEAKGEHEGYTGKLYGHDWHCGVAAVKTTAERDFLISEVGFADFVSRELEPEKIKKILVIGFVGLGDWLMATPFLAKLRKYYATATITIVCDGDSYCLFEHTGLVDEFLTVPAENVMYYIHQYDEVFNLSFGLHNCAESEIKNGYQLPCEKFGFDYEGELPVYVVSEEEKIWAKEYLSSFSRNDPLLVIHPESTSALRSLSPKRLNEILNVLEAHFHIVCISKNSNYAFFRHARCECGYEARFYYAGTDNLRIICPRCTKGILANNEDGIRYTQGKISFRQAAALVDAADLCLMVDSSLMHVAGALQKHQVVLYGSSDPELRSKHFKNTIAVRNSLPCSPCRFHNAESCVPGVQDEVASCMLSHEPREILNHLQSLYYGTPSPISKNKLSPSLTIGHFPYEVWACPACPLSSERRIVAKKGEVLYYLCLTCGCVFSQLTDKQIAWYGSDRYADYWKSHKNQKVSDKMASLQEGMSSVLIFYPHETTTDFYGIHLYRGDIEPMLGSDTPFHFPYESYEGIFFYRSLETMRHPRDVFAILASKLKPGGKIYIYAADATQCMRFGPTECAALAGFYSGENRWLPSLDSYESVYCGTGWAMSVESFEIIDDCHWAVLRKES